MWPILCWRAASVGDTEQCLWAYSAHQHASKKSYRGFATCGTDSGPAQTGSFCAHCQTVGCQYCTTSYQLLVCRCIFCDHTNWHQHVPRRSPNAQGVLLELIALTVLSSFLSFFPSFFLSFFCCVPFCFCVFFSFPFFMYYLLLLCFLFSLILFIVSSYVWSFFTSNSFPFVCLLFILIPFTLYFLHVTFPVPWGTNVMELKLSSNIVF